MYISRLVIRGFRNFRLLDVPLKNGTTCVVGENNTGKTNLIRAPLGRQPQHVFHVPEADPGGFSCRNRLPNPPAGLIIAVEFREFAGKDTEEAMVGDWTVEDDLARLTYRFKPHPEVRKKIAAGQRPADNLTIEDYHWEIRGGSTGTDPLTVRWDEDFGTFPRLNEIQQSFLVVLMHPLRDVVQELRQSRASPLGKLLDAAAIPKEEQDRLVEVLAAANDQVSGSESIAALGTEIWGRSTRRLARRYHYGSQGRHGIPVVHGRFSGADRAPIKQRYARLRPVAERAGAQQRALHAMLLRVFERRMEPERTAGQLLLVEEPERICTHSSSASCSARSAPRASRRSPPPTAPTSRRRFRWSPSWCSPMTARLRRHRRSRT